MDVVPTRSAEEWTKELTEIRQMVEFLVCRARKLDVKTDVAVRRLGRLEKENDQLQDEGILTEALADKPSVAKLIVDRWFADKGFGFGKVQSPRQRSARRRGPHDRHRS